MTVLGLYIAHRQHRHKFANNRRKIKITAKNSSKLTILFLRKIAHKSCGRHATMLIRHLFSNKFFQKHKKPMPDNTA